MCCLLILALVNILFSREGKILMLIVLQIETPEEAAEREGRERVTHHA